MTKPHTFWMFLNDFGHGPESELNFKKFDEFTNILIYFLFRYLRHISADTVKEFQDKLLARFSEELIIGKYCQEGGHKIF